MTAASVGCAIQPMKETALISDTRSVLVVGQEIERLADDCWRRRATMFKDGIHIDARQGLDGSAIVSAARFAHDIGQQQPFFVATVFSDTTGTKVKLMEGDYACEALGTCFTLGYTAQVERWLAGDRVCLPQK
jgi:hypothetical protein